MKMKPSTTKLKVPIFFPFSCLCLCSFFLCFFSLSSWLAFWMRFSFNSMILFKSKPRTFRISSNGILENDEVRTLVVVLILFILWDNLAISFSTSSFLFSSFSSLNFFSIKSILFKIILSANAICSTVELSPLDNCSSMW